MNAVELGKFIASLRNEKHITQEELAEKLYIDKKKVSRWECGTSIPEFEMLIKLSEILDVSLYELSICKRIKTNKINKKILNKLKSIKDYRKYKTKIILLCIIILVILVFFSITTIYTFKNSGSVKIYELESTSKNYSIEGNFFITPNYNSLNVYSINHIENGQEEQLFNNSNKCEYNIYCNNKHILRINSSDKKTKNTKKIEYLNANIRYSDYIKSENNYKLNINCINDKMEEKEYSFTFKINEKYNNNLF